MYTMLIRFLKLAPFNDFTVWKEMVQKTGTLLCHVVLFDIIRCRVTTCDIIV